MYEEQWVRGIVLSVSQLGEYDKSLDAFRRGLKAQPDNSKILSYNMGDGRTTASPPWPRASPWEGFRYGPGNRPIHLPEPRYRSPFWI